MEVHPKGGKGSRGELGSTLKQDVVVTRTEDRSPSTCFIKETGVVFRKVIVQMTKPRLVSKDLV